MRRTPRRHRRVSHGRGEACRRWQRRSHPCGQAPEAAMIDGFETAANAVAIARMGDEVTSVGAAVIQPSFAHRAERGVARYRGGRTAQLRARGESASESAGRYAPLGIRRAVVERQLVALPPDPEEIGASPAPRPLGRTSGRAPVVSAEGLVNCSSRAGLGHGRRAGRAGRA
jgi:hypothetical protein